MNNLGAVLHKRWISGGNSTEIIGYWAEDETEYYITVPFQLQDIIIDMQNCMAKQYEDILNREKCINRLVKELDEIKTRTGWVYKCN